MENIVVGAFRTMLEIGVIESSEIRYYLSVVIVKKKDNSNRFYLDIRTFNKVTVFDAEPIPSMDAIFIRHQDIT